MSKKPQRRKRHMAQSARLRAPRTGATGNQSGNARDESPALEAAMRADRAWFAAHPHARSYVRSSFAGEFAFDELLFFAPADALVLVTQLAPGMRARSPLWPVRDDQTEDRALALDPLSGEVFEVTDLGGYQTTSPSPSAS